MRLIRKAYLKQAPYFATVRVVGIKISNVTKYLVPEHCRLYESRCAMTMKNSFSEFLYFLCGPTKPWKIVFFFFGRPVKSAFELLRVSCAHRVHTILIHIIYIDISYNTPTSVYHTHTHLQRYAWSARYLYCSAPGYLVCNIAQCKQDVACVREYAYMSCLFCSYRFRRGLTSVSSSSLRRHRTAAASCTNPLHQRLHRHVHRITVAVRERVCVYVSCECVRNLVCVCVCEAIEFIH